MCFISLLFFNELIDFVVEDTWGDSQVKRIKTKSKKPNKFTFKLKTNTMKFMYVYCLSSFVART